MIYRVDVYACPDRAHTPDSSATAIAKQLAEAGIDGGDVSVRRVFFVDSDASRETFEKAAKTLLADPIVEHADVFAGSIPATSTGSVIEVHLKPGVMDPVAATTESALRDMGISVKQVRTGRSIRLGKSVDRSALESVAKRYLANAVVETTYFEPFLPAQFPAARIASFEIRRVPIRDLSDEQLTKLSRDGHLFLNLNEMRAIQQHYRSLARDPTDVELETLAQTWSEHCVHKTLKSAVEVVDENGKSLRHYKNLIKETIFASTMTLIERRRDEETKRQSDPSSTSSLRDSVSPSLPSDFCLSVFKDNAGVIAFDDVDAVCFKVETHNRPSAIEPYGGAATGIGGCIRDVLGTGLGARPIANTDVFCVAYPEREGGTAATPSLRHSVSPSLPPGVIHPKRILQQVVAGVRDYGNRMGIPTVNGAVYFDDRYVGNPLVFAGCIGIIPRDKVTKHVNAGDRIVVMGGRTGRDGIHGATFSSAEVTSTHADEFSHAVQIGNAITQKKMMDVLLQARDRGLYDAVTDCGAGGLSSAVGEMGGELGAEVDLDLVPLKYAGLRYDEIWISEAQERMVLAVPEQHVDELLALAKSEDVEATVIGTFGTPKHELVLRFNGTEVARMSMAFVHDGIPMPTRRAVVSARSMSVPLMPSAAGHDRDGHATKRQLLAALAHPNIASKHWVIRQYDHEVQGQTIVKPLVGPKQVGPSDAAVLQPKHDSLKGVVAACGLVPSIDDPYEMALASIDEAVRNAVCVGADLSRLAILDNFCWPGVHDDVSMGTLVRACEACRDGALDYRIPFISGKDSLHNQFTDATTGKVIRIPNTLLISAIGVIDDVRKVTTMDLKRVGSTLVRARSPHANPSIEQRRALHEQVSTLIRTGKVRAAHDVSDGGWLVAVAEMCIASGKGAALKLSGDEFAEPVAQYVLEVDAVPAGSSDVAFDVIGTVVSDATLTLASGESIAIDDLTRAWRGTLDW
jgi:phosphoribosylformylglycinamidine synthase